jgi:hypothetical protein
MAECGRGWGQRCPESKGKTCRCRCGGAHHGVYYRQRQQVQQVDEAPRIPRDGWGTVGEDGQTQLQLV